MENSTGPLKKKEKKERREKEMKWNLKDAWFDGSTKLNEKLSFLLYAVMQAACNNKASFTPVINTTRN